MQKSIIAATLVCGLALTACGAAEEPPADPQSENRDALLAYAKCMRDNGVDVPDPQFSEDGGAMVRIGPGTGLDPRSPKFQRAQKACAGKLRGPAGVTREESP